MKLFFDARFIRTDHHDGVSLYSTSLAKAVFRRYPTVTFIIHDDRQKDFLPDGAKTVKIHHPESAKELVSGRVLAKYAPDVVFSPMQTLGKHASYKLILTLQDMTYYKYNVPPENHPRLVKIGWKLFHLTYIPQRFILNKADMVSTVSHSSRKEIMDAKLTRNEVIVVTNSARSLSDFHEPPKQGVKPPKNIVFIGTGQVHKNVETLILGMKYLPGRVLHLMSPMSKRVKEHHAAIRPRGVEIVYHDGFDSEKEAEVLYDDAILVSASLAEGFGLPLVEAMDYRVPIVVSDIPVFHEVAGDAAMYFDARDPKDFAATVEKLDSKKVREAQIKLGVEQARKFNWDDSAKILVEAAERLYEKR